MADSSTDLPVLLFVMALFALLGVALWAWFAFQSNADLRSKFAGRASVPPSSAPPSSASNAGKAGTRRRRVIRLHSITPGQSPYEYNIGDIHGTRGSALVRAA